MSDRRFAATIGASLAADSRGDAERRPPRPRVDRPSGWSSYRGGAANAAAAPNATRLERPASVDWRVDGSGSLAVGEGTGYLRTEVGVRALDLADGSTRWRRDLEGVTGTPAIAADVVLVGGDRLVALEAATGEVRWTGPPSETGVASPTLVDGTAFATADGVLRAVDVADGSLRWSREAVAHADGGSAAFAAEPVAVANGTVYALTDRSGVVALNPETGATRWTWRTDRGRVDGPIVATRDRLVVGGSRTADVPILDPEAGTTEGWAWVAHPVAATDEVVVTVDRHSISAWNYAREEGWTCDASSDAYGRPAIVGDTVVVPYHPYDASHAIVGLDRRDGRERWSIPTADLDGVENAMGVDAVADGETLYVAGDRLSAVRFASGDVDPTIGAAGDAVTPDPASVEEVHGVPVADGPHPVETVRRRARSFLDGLWLQLERRRVGGACRGSRR